MAALSAKQADAAPTPNTPQHIERKSPLDMHYYLTEGLEGVKHHEFRDIQSFKGAVDALRSGNVDECFPPYLIFSPVTTRQLAKIDRFRETGYKRLRILYLNEPKVLIVKYIPGCVPEMAVKGFERAIWEKIGAGGQGAEISLMGRTTYQATESRKEPDASLGPHRARPNDSDWPTVILECGLSEYARRLTADARWWLHASGGAVKIVLLVFASAKEKTIRIELWELHTIEHEEVTRENNTADVTVPTMKEAINITTDTVTGGPLTLKFKDIFLRKPKTKRREADYVFTAEDMRSYYNYIWPSACSEDEYCESISVSSCMFFSES